MARSSLPYSISNELTNYPRFAFGMEKDINGRFFFVGVVLIRFLYLQKAWVTS
jgi:hypothetical protein